MDRAHLVLLRCRLNATGNVLRALFARGRRLDTTVVLAGGALLLAYWSGTLLQHLAQVEWCRTHPGELRACLFASGVVSGASAGGHDADRGRALASAPFLKVLPWIGDDHRRAVRLASVPAGSAGTMLAFGTAYVVFRACGTGHEAASAAAASLLFGSSFAMAAVGRSRAPRLQEATRVSVDGVGPARNAAVRTFGSIDAGVPRWLGSWALGERAPVLAVSWVLLLVTLGLCAAAGGIIERGAGPAVVAAVLGGHVVFLIGLRARPLVSDALRVQPVSFARAVWGLTRLPLLASSAWFCLPALSAFAATGNTSGQVAAGGASLLLLDAMFLVVALSLPRSPRSAVLLHLGVLGVAAQNLARFGLYADAAILLAFLVHRLRSARRAFHV